MLLEVWPNPKWEETKGPLIRQGKMSRGDSEGSREERWDSEEREATDDDVTSCSVKAFLFGSVGNSKGVAR